MVQSQLFQSRIGQATLIIMRAKPRFEATDNRFNFFSSSHVTLFHIEMRYGSPDAGVLQIICSLRESSREKTEGHARLEGKTMFFNYNFYTLTSLLSTCKVYGILF